MYVLVSVAVLVLVVGALIDIITRQDGQVLHLPKIVWVLLVIFLPLIGSILWFAIGREYSAPVGGANRSQRSGRRSPVHTDGAARRPMTTEEQLAALDREIDFHNEQARIRQLEAELEARRKQAD